MRPEPQRQLAGGSHQRAGELKSEASPPARRMDHQLAARALDRVGRVQMGVTRELAPAMEQQITRPGIAAVPEVQHDVLGERPDAIGGRGRADQREYRRGLASGEPLADADFVLASARSRTVWPSVTGWPSVTVWRSLAARRSGPVS